MARRRRRRATENTALRTQVVVRELMEAALDGSTWPIDRLLDYGYLSEGDRLSSQGGTMVVQTTDDTIVIEWGEVSEGAEPEDASPAHAFFGGDAAARARWELMKLQKRQADSS